VTGLTRRRFLAGTAAAVVLPRVAHAAGFAFGPASFDVTPTSALIWLATEDDAEVRVEYGTQPDLGHATVTPAVPTPFETDYTAVVELDRLAPDTEYFYRGVTGDGIAGAVGRFRTAPARVKPFRFAWSADMDAAHQPFGLLDATAAVPPDFFLMLGDTMYADLPREQFAPTLRHFRAKHRENRADASLQRLLAATSVVATWDDHEVENNFDRTHPALPAGLRAFREYWPARAAVLYRRFSWTPAVDVFVLDCRSYRSPAGDPNGPAKTMLGAEQQRWLTGALKASTATFKFVVSSVPFLLPGGADEWAKYPAERDELLAFLRRERIRNVVILSGDFHVAYEQERGGLHEFLAGPIGAFNPCKEDPAVMQNLRANRRFLLCDGPNYGAVTVHTDVRPARITVEIRDTTNAVRHRRIIVAA
jgi:alkaline phosphatase D